MKIKAIFQKHWPILLIFLSVLVFFWQFFVRGLVPIPSDIIVGMYYPWLDSKWGYTVGVPVKNNLLSDVVSQFWVWRNLAIDLFKTGQNPFWNPYALSGSPLVPAFHSSFFSPFNLLFWLVDRVKAMSLIVIFQPFLAMVFMYSFLKTYKLSKLSSLFGAVVFAFSGVMLAWLEWGTVGHALLCLPLLLYFIEKFLISKKGIFLIFQAITLGVCFSAGHPQTFFYCFLTWFLYFNYRLRQEKIKNFWLLPLILTFLFVFLFSFLVFPAGESFLYSIRSTEEYIKEKNFGFFPPFNIISFLAPDYFGNPATNNWWGKSNNYQELVGYFGIISLVFLMISFMIKERKISFWKLFFIISLSFSFRYPIGWVIYFLKIPLLKTASASRILCLSSFSGAILASFGFEAIKKKRIRYSSWFFWPIWILLLGYALATGISFLIAINCQNRLFDYPNSLKSIQELSTQMRIGLRNLVLPMSFLLIAQVLVFLVSGNFRFFKKEGREGSFGKIRVLLIWGIFFLTTAELFRFGWKYNPFVKANLYFPEMPLLKQIGQEAGYWRLERERGELLPPNMWIPYKIYSSSGYDPVYPASYGNFLGLLERGGMNYSPASRYGEIENYQSLLFDYLGIKYVLAIKRDGQGRVSESGKPNYKFDLTKFLRTADFGNVAVLENQAVYPRLFWVFRADFVKSDLEAAQKIIEQPQNLSEKVVLTGLPDETLLSGPWSEFSGQCQAKFIDYKSGEIKIKTDCPSPGFLVLTDTFFPGWEAFIDSEELKIFQANLSFRAIFVPKGVHDILLVYEPKSFKIGLQISGLTLISVIGFFFLKQSSLKNKE